MPAVRRFAIKENHFFFAFGKGGAFKQEAIRHSRGPP